MEAIMAVAVVLVLLMFSWQDMRRIVPAGLDAAQRLRAISASRAALEAVVGGAYPCGSLDSCTVSVGGVSVTLRRRLTGPGMALYEAEAASRTGNVVLYREIRFTVP
jgi:hypothetical protein